MVRISGWRYGLTAVGLALALAPITDCGSPAQTSPLTISVSNGVRYTVGGSQIDAHSGTILRARDGSFYWYGEAYACGFRWTDPATPYCGAQVYRSTDMTHWKGPWPLFDASSRYWQDLCMHQPNAPGNGCFRPKVVYNRSTGLYVLWLNTPGLDGFGYRVLTSPSPAGPFTLAARAELGDGAIPDWRGKPTTLDGDEGLFVDSDGTAWIVWNRDGRLLHERLNASYTSGAGSPQVIMNYPQLAPWQGVESPSEFRHGRSYYIAMSLPRCPYCTATGTAIERAPGPGGPWTYEGVITSDSCGGQPNEVDQIAPDVLLWSSDRWLRGGSAGSWPKLNETRATQAWEPVYFDGDDPALISCDSTYSLRLPAL